MNDLLNRMATALLWAIGALFVAGIPAGCIFTRMVGNDPDGQAGMGAAAGGFYVGCVAAIVTFIVSLRRSSPSRRS